jgi:hypothetical protein
MLQGLQYKTDIYSSDQEVLQLSWKRKVSNMFKKLSAVSLSVLLNPFHNLTQFL